MQELHCLFHHDMFTVQLVSRERWSFHESPLAPEMVNTKWGKWGQCSLPTYLYYILHTQSHNHKHGLHDNHMPNGLDREKVLCLYFDCWVSVFCMHVSILVHILLVSYSNDIKESPVQQDKTVG